VREKTKTVTRRNGWWFLKPGEIVNAVEKCQGLKKGEKIKKICQIRIVSTRSEALFCITEKECILEGFPGMRPDEFIKRSVKPIGLQPMGCKRLTLSEDVLTDSIWRSLTNRANKVTI
jgi:hypothetical protein